MSAKKALLAYSGGLDTSAILVWLQKEMQLDVICYCCDLGNVENPEQIGEKAYKFGAKKYFFDDCKEEFVKDYVFPMLKAGATYENGYLLGTAIARPIIAEKMANIANEMGVDFIVHGATGKGNDQLRFEQTWAKMCPDVKVLAPWKVWDFKGRQDLIKYLASHGIEYSGESKGKYSIDENLLHKSTEGAELEKIDIEFDPSVLSLLASETKTNEKILTLTFKHGEVESVNNEKMTPAQLLTYLNSIGSQFGIGTQDIVEERANGVKSRGIYTTPGGTILKFGVDKMKEICWNHKMTAIASQLAFQFGELIYQGLWHSMASQAVKGFFDKAGECLTGELTLKIKNNQIFVLKRSSPNSLYSESLVSFEHDGLSINKLAAGYCAVQTLSMRTEGRVACPS
ncbi:MAG: argininosuccinate synthase [Oligoflexales bacterium]|nr:argininosuccinate synthase [Oligoflexales bacterium]